MLEILKYNFFPFIICAPDDGDGAAGGGAGGQEGGDGAAGGGAGGQEGDASKKVGGTQKPGAIVGGDGDGLEGKPKEGDDAGDKSDWRKSLAGEDEKDLATLNRFNSQKDLWKAYKELRASVSGKGGKFPIEGTDEQKAEWREKNGMPKEADGYLDMLPEGLVLGEDIKEGAADYLKEMHNMNAPADIVAKGLEMYAKNQEAQAEAISQMDQQKAANATAELKEKWAEDYPANIQALHNFIEGNFPKDVQEALMNGRLGDDEGTPIFCNAAVIEAFSRIQRELNPMGSVSSGQGMDSLDAIEDQIKIYEDRMGNDRQNWYKDEKAQAHYRELINARERYKTKSN